MSARWEIVRSDAPQQWHARLVVNGRIVTSSETYSRIVGAERSLLSVMRATTGHLWGLRWNVEGVEKVLLHLGTRQTHQLNVRYLDERAAS